MGDLKLIVYKTTNLLNGKIYIGQHSKDRNSYYGSGIILNKSIKKYGKENFKRETIEVCETREILHEREEYWIKQYDATNPEIGYNIRAGGGLNGGDYDISGSRNPNFGNQLSADALERIRIANLGTYVEKFGIERANILKHKRSLNTSGEKNPMFGITPPSITCEKCGKSVDARNYSRWHGEKCNPKIKEIKDRSWSQERKDEMSIAMKARVMTDEHKDKLRNSLNKNRIKCYELLTCEKCGKEMTKGNYVRWHGDNCKQ